MSEIKTPVQAKKLIDDLQSLRENKTAMSVFKGCLSESRQHKAWPYIIQRRWCDINNRRMRTIVLHLIALYAMHPHHDSGAGSIGESLRKMAFKRSDIEPIQRNERHIKRLIASEGYKILCARIAYVMRLIKSVEVPVDFERLYTDIIFWNESTQIRWASDYYIKGEEDVSDEDHSCNN